MNRLRRDKLYYQLVEYLDNLELEVSLRTHEALNRYFDIYLKSMEKHLFVSCDPRDNELARVLAHALICIFLQQTEFGTKKCKKRNSLGILANGRPSTRLSFGEVILFWLPTTGLPLLGCVSLYRYFFVGEAAFLKDAAGCFLMFAVWTQTAIWTRYFALRSFAVGPIGVKCWNCVKEISDNVPFVFNACLELNKSDFQGLDLTGVNLTKCFVQECNFNDAKLEKANLTESQLFETSFISSNLSRANLEKAILVQTNFSKANLVEANLVKANLNRAKLTEAVLSRADFAHAKLQEAILNKGNFAGANFEGADLTACWFNGS